MFSSQNPSYVVFLSAVLLIISSFFSIGFFQSDEHFQILEFAALKLGGIDQAMMPWEYEFQMRSAFQPLIALIVHRFFGFFGVENPFTITTILRILSAIVSFIGMYILYTAYKDQYKQTWEQKWFKYLSFLLWCSIFVGVRFSSEGWSGSLIAVGFGWYFVKKKEDFWKYLSMGLIFGFAFLCRYQVGLMIGGFGLWLFFIKEIHIKNLLNLSAGLLLVVGLGLLIDLWYYGEWTWTVWHYIDQNIIQDKVSGFGVDPWYDYLLQLGLALIPPFSLVPIFAFVYLMFRWPKHEVVWTLTPFLLVHFLIGHKELRFLFPALVFLPVIAMEFFSLLNKHLSPDLFQRRWIRRLSRVFVGVNTMLLIFVCTTSFDRTTPFYRFMYYHYSEPVTLYYLGTDPYKLGHLTYYKRPHLVVKQIENIDQLPINPDKGILLVIDRPNKLNDSDLDAKLLYSSIPSWVWHLNFNHWIERTLAWYLYEIKPGK